MKFFTEIRKKKVGKKGVSVSDLSLRKLSRVEDKKEARAVIGKA